MAKDKGWVIVTRDVRMALRSLIDGVPIIFINDDYKTVSYVTSKTHSRKKYTEMFEYISEKLGCK